ncbi:MAG: response regulator [Bdellovibrio sp.]|nr:response regulator [Bdellovibrio sp.]
MTPKSILLVQHDKQGREALAITLRRSNYQISSASQGMQALTLLEERSMHFHCLIVIDHLEDMPGQELIGLVRSRFQEIKTIMVSSQADEEEEQFVKANGCDVYMPDYSDKNILLKAIEGLL